MTSSVQKCTVLKLNNIKTRKQRTHFEVDRLIEKTSQQTISFSSGLIPNEIYRNNVM